MGSSKKERGSEKRGSRHRHRDDSDDDERKRGSRRRNRSKERDRSKNRDRSRSPREKRDKKRERSSSPHRRDKRERSGSPHHKDRKERSGSKDRESSKKRREDDTRGRSKYDGRSSRGDNQSPQQEERKAEEMSADVPARSGDTSSLSIEETNKLRAKLGLKPLQVEGAVAQKTEETEGGDAIAPMKTEEFHAPPTNIGHVKAAEKLREKMSTMKDTRQLAKKLGSTRTLGESDSDDGEDNTTSWVERMRQKEDQKRAADKKARMLAEMDEEFGIGDLVNSTIGQSTNRAYAAADLAGLAVEHSTQAFKEGRNIVLTLKDSGVLEEMDDVLVNVNIVDAEKAAKNVENKKKTRQNPYDEVEEMDEFGNVNQPTLLKKYDEEIEGEKKKSFTLGVRGDVDTSEEARLQQVKDKLQEKQVSLETGPSHIASEYYTSEEMVKFKKPKKKRKVRKKLKADDILPLGDVGTKDHGSRRDHGSRTSQEQEEVSMDVSMDIDEPVPEATTTDLRDDDTGSVTTALEKTRRLVKRGRGEPHGAAMVANMLQSVPQIMVKEEPSDDMPEGTIILNTTSEFCRQVGEDEKPEKRRVSVAELEDEFGVEEIMELDTPQFNSSEGGWSEVQGDTEKKQDAKFDELYQEAEPMASTSVLATLQLAARKGFIPHEKRKDSKGSKTSQGDAKKDLEYERQKERERERELSKYQREGSFPEKKGYKPNVRIVHVDDSGRELSIKEAFRFMSHKFHGKGSGKKKIEKRLKKIQEEEFLKSSSSIDTPLNTLAMLKSKQAASQSPYILLKGAGAQSLQAPDVIRKRK
ncbi:U4/U6.U5 tri-snRNP-associated protein 1-like [Halichondria panicea]|uniref:U4/U6.U5 tri-snRNP-associated protein 1-like n=1 Tax=Halichondria panicea TaxID=6063 RepID=UPI00312BBB3E